MNRICFKLCFILTIILTETCTNKSDNKVHIPLLLPTGQVYLLNDDIDASLSSNCGIATPGNSSSTTNTTPTTNTTNTSGTPTTLYTIVSQFTMKTTRENLILKFAYDSTQFQGPINSQQGFVMTGGAFGNTVTGTQGTIKWTGGIGTINSGCTGPQQLQYFNLSLNLSGYYTPGIATTTIPTTCFTTDNVNCNTSGTVSCYTTDNKTCLVNTTTTGSIILIQGTVKCNSQTVVSSCG